MFFATSINKKFSKKSFSLFSVNLHRKRFWVFGPQALNGQGLSGKSGIEVVSLDLGYNPTGEFS